jgi:hypothetical protein
LEQEKDLKNPKVELSEFVSKVNDGLLEIEKG